MNAAVGAAGFMAACKPAWLVDREGRVSCSDRAGQIEKSSFGVAVTAVR